MRESMERSISSSLNSTYTKQKREHEHLPTPDLPHTFIGLKPDPMTPAENAAMLRNTHESFLS